MKKLFGKINLPIYIPDGTRGVVKGLDSSDLDSIQIPGIVVNTFHLMNNPGIGTLKLAGGIKNYMNFRGLVVSDSGGWQIFSLVHKSKKGKITDEGVTFDLYKDGGAVFTPEISIKTQIQIGSDILICLDDFTPPYSDYETANKSVEKTIRWAEMCKQEFIASSKKFPYKNIKPKLFAVIQGGEYKDLREKCFKALEKIGFDGYGFGGYPIDNDGNLDYDISEFISNLIGDKFVKFALGVGRPRDIARLSRMGWDIFDCTLPTRDARHKRLYTFTGDVNTSDLTDELFSFIYISRSRYKDDMTPVSEYCDCLLCKNYSRSYLWHLFKIDEMTAHRLASIHNLRIYTLLTQRLQKERA